MQSRRPSAPRRAKVAAASALSRPAAGSWRAGNGQEGKAGERARSATASSPDPAQGGAGPAGGSSRTAPDTLPLPAELGPGPLGRARPGLTLSAPGAPGAHPAWEAWP